jgi:hypothetical protein
MVGALAGQIGLANFRFAFAQSDGNGGATTTALLSLGDLPGSATAAGLTSIQNLDPSLDDATFASEVLGYVAPGVIDVTSSYEAGVAAANTSMDPVSNSMSADQIFALADLPGNAGAPDQPGQGNPTDVLPEVGSINPAGFAGGAPPVDLDVGF